MGSRTSLEQMDVTIVLPTFNQPDALLITLESFAYQKEIEGSWELILVDDGSDDETQEMIAAYTAPYPFTYLRIDHAGRAAARNAGLRVANGKIIIFCDSDRAVCNHFIASHLQPHIINENVAVIGDIWEFFFSDLNTHSRELINDLQNDFRSFHHQARRPAYARAVYQMFTENGGTQYAMPWIAFFSGNASVKADHLRAVGGFDEDFKEWGFEHFELGYRLFAGGIEFAYVPSARNYHFSHRRPPGFYEESLNKSFDYFCNKHSGLEVSLLMEFLTGKLSLQQYHNHIANTKELPLVSEENHVYYRQLSRR